MERIFGESRRSRGGAGFMREKSGYMIFIKGQVRGTEFPSENKNQEIEKIANHGSKKRLTAYMERMR